MEDNAYIGTILAGVFYIAIGARLGRLRARTGQLPEGLLCVCFLMWGASYFLYALPSALAQESLLTPCFFVGRLLSHLGTLACSIFTWKVFRESDDVAKIAVAAIAMGLVIGMGGNAWAGDWEGSSPLSSAWYWLEWAGSTAPCVWIGVEAFIQYRRAGQRHRLGLCDGLVRNRYLLWGLVGVAWVALQCIYIAQDIAWERNRSWSALSDTLVGVLEFSSIATVWLVFFPPAFYRKWLGTSSGEKSAAEDGA